MYLGIDVGGTHTDAVALTAGTGGEPQVVATAKVTTDHANLLRSVRAALEDVLSQVRASLVKRINLSTTLTTNAIVTGNTEPVGLIVSSGPGMNPEPFLLGQDHGSGFCRGAFVLSGSIDHRGFEVEELDAKGLAEAVACCRELGLSVHAAVTKFSTRNPVQEEAIKAALGEQTDFCTLGHRLSGVLGFPRRIATAYYNSAVWRTYNRFADAMEQSVREHGLTAQVNVLKADGGTMPLALSREHPVQSILSGPAASVMGVVALCEVLEDCVILDIGGTTTDVALFADGAPLVERDGLAVKESPTLVRALKSTSIGVGGDSHLHVEKDETNTETGGIRVSVGPDRVGPCMAKGGSEPTLMDACNYLRMAAFGDREASKNGIERLAALWDAFPEKLARAAVADAVGKITSAVRAMTDAVNARPVYTIHELLKGKELRPRKAYVMGGPALVFKETLAKALSMEVETPENPGVANAIGAALTRTTLEAELFADTEKHLMRIPSLGIHKRVDADYNLKDGAADVLQALNGHLLELGVPADEARDIEVTEASAFNMVDFFGATGRTIRVRCQVKPGISRI